MNEIKENDVKMITDQPGFMRRDVNIPSRGERLADIGIYIISFLMLALWATMFATQILSPERIKIGL
jgi:hypothetical protein